MLLKIRYRCSKGEHWQVTENKHSTEAVCTCAWVYAHCLESQNWFSLSSVMVSWVQQDKGKKHP